MTDEGDCIIFDVCRVLNSKVWPDQVDEVLLEKQLEAITNIHNRYSTLSPYSLIEMKNSYIDAAQHAKKYFNTSENDPHDIWAAMGKLKKDGFNPAMLLIELCLCAPFSNATLERFFSHMKYI